ncbi:hypothetical protein ACGFOU_11735 [Streptomyces sp. NPDC048595]|uniref:hypothetical protein n=1 Tax=Streptomyces sp. NPDC048595 TaxID=3365576 RepID=UPI003713E75E
MFGTLFVATCSLRDALGLDPLQCGLRVRPPAVMTVLSAPAVIVRYASVGDAGVTGGLRRTAMNIGPALGVAAATMLTGLITATGHTLTVLAVIAALGALAARRLPSRSRRTGNAAAAPRVIHRRRPPKTLPARLRYRR